ncbi:MAG: hypothetical protein AB1627_01130 [Chloroflexota bacterium]
MTDDYKIRLIDLADSIARQALPAGELAKSEIRYLKRFRAAYQHLASSVEKTPGHRDDETTAGEIFGTQRS